MEKTNSNTTGNKDVKESNASKEVKNSNETKLEKVKKERKPRGERRSKRNNTETGSSIERLMSVDISNPQNLIDAGFTVEKLQLLYIKTAIDYLKGVK